MRAILERKSTLEDWGFSRMKLSEFIQLYRAGYQQFGSTCPFENNPFEMSTEDSKAAFRELESLRLSNDAHNPKWLWLEECLLTSVELLVSWQNSREEILTALEQYTLPLTVSQKALALKQGLENMAEIELFCEDTSPITAEDVHKAAEMRQRIEHILDSESLTRFAVAVEADAMLSKILRN